MDTSFDLLTVALLPGVGSRTARDLAARGSLSEVLAHAGDHADLLSGDARDSLRSGEAWRAAEDEWDRARQRGIAIVGWDEPAYPLFLRRIYDPPPVLYVRGRLVQDEGPRSVALVGSRAASPQGRVLAHAMARDLASAGVTVVSGLARGIDTEGHRGALAAGGRTVAVLGSGLDRIYPGENEALVEPILARGAVVSEFPLVTAPHAGNFPRRNRVIAGWSRAVVVVEAGDRSGALGTARLALEEGREVLAVPGHPSHPGSAGTNRLIRDGAVLVRDGGDVAAELGLPVSVGMTEGASRDEVLESLRRDSATSLDELHERSGRPMGELLSRLTELELSEKVRRLPGALFVRS